jgi:hypothetical protein
MKAIYLILTLLVSTQALAENPYTQAAKEAARMTDEQLGLDGFAKKHGLTKRGMGEIGRKAALRTDIHVFCLDSEGQKFAQRMADQTRQTVDLIPKTSAMSDKKLEEIKARHEEQARGYETMCEKSIIKGLKGGLTSDEIIDVFAKNEEKITGSRNEEKLENFRKALEYDSYLIRIEFACTRQLNRGFNHCYDAVTRAQAAQISQQDIDAATTGKYTNEK